jgi:hypothetical protein
MKRTAKQSTEKDAQWWLLGHRSPVEVHPGVGPTGGAMVERAICILAVQAKNL